MISPQATDQYGYYIMHTSGLLFWCWNLPSSRAGFLRSWNKHGWFRGRVVCRLCLGRYRLRVRAHWSRLWEMNGLITSSTCPGNAGSRAGNETEGPGRRKSRYGQIEQLLMNVASPVAASPFAEWENWATRSSAAPRDQAWRMGDAPERFRVSF